jgi:hypothetical protein
MHPTFESGVSGKKIFASKNISLFVKYATVIVRALDLRGKRDFQTVKKIIP